MLAPYLAGAWLNSRWHTRSQEPKQEIAGGVWLGRIPTRAELQASGIASVVDLAPEFSFSEPDVVYRSVPMLDLLTPSADQLAAAVNAIEELDSARPTLVFCALGYSRSARAVAAWLVASHRAQSFDDAVEYIRERRPYIVLASR
jgi:protein-tyrosine phosphatase